MFAESNVGFLSIQFNAEDIRWRDSCIRLTEPIGTGDVRKWVNDNVEAEMLWRRRCQWPYRLGRMPKYFMNASLKLWESL